MNSDFIDGNYSKQHQTNTLNYTQSSSDKKSWNRADANQNRDGRLTNKAHIANDTSSNSSEEKYLEENQTNRFAQSNYSNTGSNYLYSSKTNDLERHKKSNSNSENSFEVFEKSTNNARRAITNEHEFTNTEDVKEDPKDDLILDEFTSELKDKLDQLLETCCYQSTRGITSLYSESSEVPAYPNEEYKSSTKDHDSQIDAFEIRLMCHEIRDLYSKLEDKEKDLVRFTTIVS